MKKFILLFILPISLTCAKDSYFQAAQEYCHEVALKAKFTLEEITRYHHFDDDTIREKYNTQIMELLTTLVSSSDPKIQLMHARIVDLGQRYFAASSNNNKNLKSLMSEYDELTLELASIPDLYADFLVNELQISPHKKTANSSKNQDSNPLDIVEIANKELKNEVSDKNIITSKTKFGGFGVIFDLLGGIGGLTQAAPFFAICLLAYFMQQDLINVTDRIVHGRIQARLEARTQRISNLEREAQSLDHRFVRASQTARKTRNAHHEASGNLSDALYKKIAVPILNQAVK